MQGEKKYGRDYFKLSLRQFANEEDEDRFDRGGGVNQEFIEQRRKKRMELGFEFLKAAKKGNARRLSELLQQDAPVNCVDPVDHAGVLHYIAAYCARPSLRVVIKSDKIDFLIRDWEGRLPSEIAREYGHDDAMARLLAIKEIRQAQAQGIDPGSLYKISSRNPTP